MSTSTIDARMDALIASIATTETVLKTLAQTDRTALGLAQAALSASKPQSAGKPATSAALGELAGEMHFLSNVSMDDLLDEWRRLYTEGSTAAPQADIDVDSAPQLVEHQAIFRTMVAHLKTLATVRNREADTFRTDFASLAKLIGQNAPVEKTLIARMHAVGTQLLHNETWLSAGNDAGAQVRSVTYQSLQREGMTSNTQAEQLVELIQLDLMRLKWVSEFEPALKAQTEALASASAALGGS